MDNKCLYIFNTEWFEHTALKNPICTSDHALEESFPEFYSLNYDVRILAVKESTAEEKSFPFYNDYYERYGVRSLSFFDEAFEFEPKKYIFLNGFNQQQFMRIAPKIKDTAEVIYFFKCPKIKDLSVLSNFINLKCVHMFWNNSLESLWEMRGNKHLKVISFQAISKLKNIEALRDSSVEYIHLDSSDNNGNRKPALFYPIVFEQMQHLKYLSLGYKNSL